jgi:hypothetical protein
MLNVYRLRVEKDKFEQGFTPEQDTANRLKLFSRFAIYGMQKLESAAMLGNFSNKKLTLHTNKNWESQDFIKRI